VQDHQYLTRDWTMSFKYSQTHLQKTYILPQITWQENPQGKQKNGKCVIQFE